MKTSFDIPPELMWAFEEMLVTGGGGVCMMPDGSLRMMTQAELDALSTDGVPSEEKK